MQRTLLPTGTSTPAHLFASFRPRLEQKRQPGEGSAWLTSCDPEPKLSPPPCLRSPGTACPEKCWKLGEAPGQGTCFSCFPQSSLQLGPGVQAGAFMSEEPEPALSILTARAGAGQVWVCKGRVYWLGGWEAGRLGGWGRCTCACVYTELGVNQGDLCPAPSSPGCEEFRLQSQTALGIKPNLSNSWQCDLEQTA